MRIFQTIRKVVEVVVSGNRATENTEPVALADELALRASAPVRVADTLAASDELGPATARVQDTGRLTDEITTATGDASRTEPLTAADALGDSRLLLVTGVAVLDEPHLAPRLPDTAAIADTLDITGEPGPVDSVGLGATDLRGTFLVRAHHDSWVDQAAATATHGSETTMLCRVKGAITNDERRAVAMFDLSSLTAFDATSDATLSFWISNANSLGENVTVQAFTSGTPIDEATLNWNNQPNWAGLTQVLQATFTAPNSEAQRTATITLANLDLALGTYLIVRWIGTGAAGVGNQSTIRTSEHASGQGPVLTFSARRPIT